MSSSLTPASAIGACPCRTSRTIWPGRGCRGTRTGAISIDGGIVQSLDAGRGIDINDPSTDSPEVAPRPIRTAHHEHDRHVRQPRRFDRQPTTKNRLISKHNFAVSPSLMGPRSPCRAASYRPRAARPAP